MVARETPKLRIRASTVKAFGQEFSVAGGCGQGSELVAVQLARLRDKPIGEMLAGDIGHAALSVTRSGNGAQTTTTARGAGTEHPLHAASARPTAAAARGTACC